MPRRASKFSVSSRKGKRLKPRKPPKVDGELDVAGEGATQIKRQPHMRDPTKQGKIRARTREYYGELLADEQMPNALAFVNRALATLPLPKDAPHGTLPQWLDPTITPEVRVRVAQLVLEYTLGKPRQQIDLDVKLGAATAWVTDAHVAQMNRVAVTLPEGSCAARDEEAD